jgi:putative membrane protein
MTVAHSHQLRAQLRGDVDATTDASRFLSSENVQIMMLQRNRADSIIRLAAAAVADARKAGTIDSYWSVALTVGLNELGHVQGGCERIASTPLPFPYSLLVGRTAYIYILLAPFAMAADLGWWTVIFNAVLAYTLFGLDELATQLEEPFKTGDLCLALAAICRLIEISVAEVSVLLCMYLTNVSPSMPFTTQQLQLPNIALTQSLVCWDGRRWETRPHLH